MLPTHNSTLTSVQTNPLGRSPSLPRCIPRVKSSRKSACRHITNGTCICNLQASYHGSHLSKPVTCSAQLYLSCPKSAVGFSVRFRQTDRHLSFRHAEPVQEKRRKKAKRGQRTPTPQSQPTHRYSTGNRTINTTRRPNPTQPRRNAPRPSTTARQSPISMDEASTYVRTQIYTLAYMHAPHRIASHCIALQQKQRQVGIFLHHRLTLTNNKTRDRQGSHPRTWGDFSSIYYSN
jgi:hypothetical protein